MLSIDQKLPTLRETVFERSNHPGEFWEIANFKNLPNFQENTTTEPFFSRDEDLRTDAGSHIHYAEKILLKILQKLLENMRTGVSFI